MKYELGKTVVVALGGSIVHPKEGIDAAYLRRFKKFLKPFLARGTKFVLVIGGGDLARRFQDAAHRVSGLADEDKDWLGIHATRLNGHLLRAVFRDVADPVMIDERGRIGALKHPVTIAAGWRPGWSTDYVALQLAADFKAGAAIIAGKPSHVYESDPAKHPAAEKFNRISWPEYRRLIPKSWKPGLHAPVDPVGAAFASREDLAAVIIDGRDLRNFGALLKGRDFRGTIIR